VCWHRSAGSASNLPALSSFEASFLTLCRFLRWSSSPVFVFLVVRIRHRGPDWTGIVVTGNCAIAHERLSIVDPESGAQPLQSADQRYTLAVNGEIYNHVELKEKLASEGKHYPFATASDCEVVIPMYQQHAAKPEAFINDLRGMFSFVCHDKTTGRYIAVRDHMGITPLYIGYGTDGSVWFASECKALATECPNFEHFPPGHYFDSDTRTMKAWYSPDWLGKSMALGEAYPPTPTTPIDYEKLRADFTLAVKRRLMTDVPWGVLLSGGLDSSLVASVASRLAAKRQEDGGEGEAHFPRLHSFTIGLDGSPDLIAAQKVADHLGTVHHAYTFTVQEGLDALSEVIYHLETYDVTTIRASTPMFLMARKIKAMGIKMVLSGEGADEVFGGYLYFHKAPNETEFYEETVDKLKNLYMFDNLRANKSTSAWGVEARGDVFLDVDLLETAMSMAPADKMVHKAGSALGAGSDPRMGIEKYSIRKAFDTPEDPYLPDDILWRQKEQFSDGVGYSWIDGIQEYAETSVSNEQLAAAVHRFPTNTPETKEAYLFRSMFELHYPQQAAIKSVNWGKSIACSTERALGWSAEWAGVVDPSGRAVKGVHEGESHQAKPEKEVSPPRKKPKVSLPSPPGPGVFQDNMSPRLR
jgi:asparagine synthase (glutamine-hydrolysing)